MVVILPNSKNKQTEGSSIGSTEKKSMPVKNMTEMEKLKELVEENIELTKGLEEKMKKVYHFVIWQRIFTVLKILVIVVPIILGIIYLPPLISSALAPYRELLFDVQDTKDTLDNIDIKSLLR